MNESTLRADIRSNFCLDSRHTGKRDCSKIKELKVTYNNYNFGKVLPAPTVTVVLNAFVIYELSLQHVVSSAIPPLYDN